MELSSDLIERFMHDTIKPVRSVVNLFTLEPSLSKALGGAGVLETYRLSLECVEQAMYDFSFLVHCERDSQAEWNEFAWNELLAEEISRLKRKIKEPFDVDLGSQLFISKGNLDLISRALYNVGWFTRHFSNRLLRISAAEADAKDRKVITVAYDIETARPISSADLFVPFALVLGENRTITDNSGFMLSLVKKIMQLHQGDAVGVVDGKRLRLQLTCPTVDKGEAGL